MEHYAQETINIANSTDWRAKIAYEVYRLVISGAVDQEFHDRGTIYAVALENVAKNYLRGEKKSRDYRNLKRI